MSGPAPDDLRVVGSFAGVSQAQVAIEWLESHGIRARIAGSYTAEFQTEVASDVDVIVSAREEARAQDLLVQLPQQDIDWSTIDCGDTTPVTHEEIEQPQNLQKRFPITSLLLLQFCIAVGAVIANWSHRAIPASQAHMLAGVLAFAFVVGCLIVTVRMSESLRRTAEAWRFLLYSAVTLLTVYLIVGIMN